MKPYLLAACVVSLGLAALPAGAQMETATASFVDPDGQSIGQATLTETPSGVLIDVEIEGLPAGEHGFHIHETGACDPASGFETAGSHFNPDGRDHGYHSENGPHAGDLPNQFVGDDGSLRAHVLAPDVTLGEGETSLFDDDGSAIVVHAGADDYTSQPSGDAGDRLACAVIERS